MGGSFQTIFSGGRKNLWGQNQQNNQIRQQQAGIQQVRQRKNHRQTGKAAGGTPDQKDTAIKEKCVAAVAEQIFHTALTVQTKADDRSKGKQRKRDPQQSAAGFSHHAAKCLIGTGGTQRDTACQNRKCCDGADQDGVAEHLKNSPEALFDRTVRTAAGVSDGGAAQSRLMGEDAAGDADPHTGEKSDSAARRTGDAAGGKRLCQNLRKGRRDILPEMKEDDPTAKQVEGGHPWD